MKFVQKVVGTIKATLIDTKGATDVHGNPFTYDQPKLPVELEREGTTVKVTFGGAVREAWFDLYDLQRVLAKMASESEKESSSYWDK